ncbi:MAG: hypothetical protein Kow0059_13600 [Candidatus Sumerlaeia bacterium]
MDAGSGAWSGAAAEEATGSSDLRFDGQSVLAAAGPKAVRKGRLPKYPDEAWKYFMQRRADFQTGAVPANYREVALEHTRKYTTRQVLAGRGLKTVAPQWSQVGPVPRQGYAVGPRGRIVDLAVVPGNDQIIYAGTASGGVWKTTNQGQSWTQLTDEVFPSLGIGAIELAPGAPDTIYAGLSEGMEVFWYEPLGLGVYRSTDGGQNWQLVPGLADVAVVTDIRFGATANTIYVAAHGYRTSGGRVRSGFWKSTDGGTNWTQTRTDACRAISVDPTNDQNVVATFRDAGNNEVATVFYSTNGGDTWTKATQPAAPNAMRIELARSLSSPQTLYALVGNSDSSLGGIWKSTDGGQNWTALPQTGIPTDPNEKPGQMTYNNCIAVKPDDANTVYFGTNLRAYKSTDGGTTWNSITYWTTNQMGLPVIHADHHDIAFGNSSSTVMYATDGGLFISFDGGASWVERNNNIICTQIYRMSNNPNDANHIVIGAQDNAAYFRKRDGNWIYNGFWGDAMECIIDPNQPCYVYVVNYYGSTMTFTNNYGEDDTVQQNWYFLRMPDGSNGIPKEESGAWVIPLWLDPLDSSKIYCVIQHLYRADMNRQCAPNQPPTHTWQRLATFNGSGYRGETAAMTYGPTNRKIFLFLSRIINQQLSVALLRVDVANPNIVDTLTMPRLGFINAIACDPNNNDTVWIGYSDLFMDPHQAVPRIYKSTSRGDDGSWVDVTNNFPSSTPVNALFIDPGNSNTVLAGTDTGVYRTDDGGANWYSFGDGLPNITVTDFDFVNSGRIVRAATYGRGLWETPLDGPQGTPQIRVEPKSLSFP